MCVRLVHRCFWQHVDAATTTIKLNPAIHEGEDGVIAAKADVPAGNELRSALADDDIAGDDDLSAEFLDAKTLALAVATVFDGSLSFLVGHKSGGGVKIRD